MTPLENPAQIKALKKQVAQLKTVLRQKELQA
jgi:ribosomal protein L29